MEQVFDAHTRGKSICRVYTLPNYLFMLEATATEVTVVDVAGDLILK